MKGGNDVGLRIFFANPSNESAWFFYDRLIKQTVTGLGAGTNYNFRVSSFNVNANGDEVSTSVINATTLDATSNPLVIDVLNLPPGQDYYVQARVDKRNQTQDMGDRVLYAGSYVIVNSTNSMGVSFLHHLYSGIGDVLITIHPTSDTGFTPPNSYYPWWQFAPGNVYENGLPGFDDAENRIKVSP